MTSSRDFTIERPRGTLTDKVTEALVRLIRSGQYQPRSRLPSELEMAARFGVSRTVVREAVSRLKSEGLVESHQGKGVFVRRAGGHVPFRIDHGELDSVRAVLQIVELRKGLEAEAAALAAARRTSADLAEIRRQLGKIDKDVRAGRDGVLADMAFHRAIARATRNPHFLSLWDFIGQFLVKAFSVTRSYEGRYAELVAQVREEHEAVADAIARRDPEAARGAARRHLEMAATRISSADRSFWESEGGKYAGGLAAGVRHVSRKARRARGRSALRHA